MKLVAGLNIEHIEQCYYQKSLDNETKTGARIVRADDTQHCCMGSVHSERGERRMFCCTCTGGTAVGLGYTQI